MATSKRKPAEGVTVIPKAYALFWLTRDSEDHGWLANTLVYRPPSGAEVRTYYEGHLDPRAGVESDFPRFDLARQAFTWMAAHPGEKCLVEVTAARHIRTDKYAEPV